MVGEDGSDIAGWREDYKEEETGIQCGMEFEDLWRQDLTSFWSEVDVKDSVWWLCFSDLQDEPQYMSLGFCYLYQCYS